MENWSRQKKAAEGFIQGAIKYDAKEMKKYMTEDEASGLEDDDLSADMFAADEDFNFMADVVKNLTYKFKSGDVKAEDKETQLTYELTRPDVTAMIEEIQKQVEANGEYTKPSIDVKKFANKTVEIKIDLTKENDAWKVKGSDDLALQIWALDEFLDALGSFFGE